MKKDKYPEELTRLIEQLKKKKPTKQTNKPDKDKTKKEKEVQEQEDSEFITKVNTRNDLELDYTDINNVKKKIEELEAERKYDPNFHA